MCLSLCVCLYLDASQKLLHFPDAPSKVGIIKNFQGGVFVVWDPVK
jgi:hypothetical protein